MNNEDISKHFLLSLLAHLVLVLLFTVNAVFFPDKEEPYQAAIRVDIVGLPDKVTPPLASPEAPIEETKQKADSKPEELVKDEKSNEAQNAKNLPQLKESKPLKKETEDLVLNSKKNKISINKEELKQSPSQAIEKLKKKMAIDKIKEELTVKERMELANRVLKYKGNVLTPGTELTGISKLQHENFLNQIDHHVKQFWSLPEWLAKGDYKAKAKIYIDSKGFLLKIELISLSGNSSYDDIVLETIKKAVPFPPPPEKFRDIMSVSGMVLGFPE